MKKQNASILPIFVAVVSLLAIGAIGESIVSLFEKARNFSFAQTPEEEREQTLEYSTLS